MKIRLGDTLHFDLDRLDLDIVSEHQGVLRARRLYERALLHAYVNTNHAHWSQAGIIELFRHADPARLRRAGDRLPSAGPSFKVFQGGSAYFVHAGLSWTLDVEYACWFAERHSDPVIWAGVVTKSEILVYVNRKYEQEIIVLPEHVRERRRLRLAL
jgi:hypothetical protein